jgi:hypothetical protein
MIYLYCHLCIEERLLTKIPQVVCCILVQIAVYAWYVHMYVHIAPFAQQQLLKFLSLLLRIVSDSGLPLMAKLAPYYIEWGLVLDFCSVWCSSLDPKPAPWSCSRRCWLAYLGFQKWQVLLCWYMGEVERSPSGCLLVEIGLVSHGYS